MPTVQAISEREGKWIFVAPVPQLKLYSAVNKEFKVHKVTLIDVGKLARVRKRFGFPERIRILRKHVPIDRMFNMADTVAIVRRTGRPSELWPKVSRLIEEELQILAVSQLGYRKRRFNTQLSLARSMATTSYFCLDTSTPAAFWSNALTSKFGDLNLSKEWLDYQKGRFFLGLWRILNGEIQVERSWRNSLHRAARLLGQSQASTNISQSFLWNVIAIELLLTRQGDKYSEEIPKRIEAFLGWVGFWDTANYEEKIKVIYGKRSQYVHDGKEAQISIEDLLFTDELALNLLINLVRFHRMFDCKDRVIEFSKKVEAEFLLGIKSRVRPKELTYLVRKYSPDDYKAI